MYPPVGRPPAGDGAEASWILAQKLRELPAERTPPFDWAELQQRTLERAASRRCAYEHRRSPRQAILLAAALASVVAAVLLADRIIRSAGAPADRSSAAHAPSDAKGLPNDAAREPDPVLWRAAAAERWLASEPDDQPIVRVSTHLVVTGLEDQIASVDDLLNVERLRNAHARVHALQLERAQLVDSLAQVRYAEMLTTEPP